MSPLRLLLTLVFAVVLVVSVYSLLALVWRLNSDIYYYATGRNWTWGELPEPLGPVLRDLYEVVAPHFLLAVVVLAIIAEFVLMFSVTREGYHEVVGW